MPLVAIPTLSRIRPRVSRDGLATRATAQIAPSIAHLSASTRRHVKAEGSTDSTTQYFTNQYCGFLRGQASSSPRLRGGQSFLSKGDDCAVRPFSFEERHRLVAKDGLEARWQNMMGPRHHETLATKVASSVPLFAHLDAFPSPIPHHPVATFWWDPSLLPKIEERGKGERDRNRGYIESTPGSPQAVHPPIHTSIYPSSRLRTRLSCSCTAGAARNIPSPSPPPKKRLLSNHCPWRYDSSSFQRDGPLLARIEHDHLLCFLSHRDGTHLSLLSRFNFGTHGWRNVRIDFSSVWIWCREPRILLALSCAGELCLR